MTDKNEKLLLVCLGNEYRGDDAIGIFIARQLRNMGLSEDDVMKLDVPDIFNSYPMTEMIRQIDYLKEKYGNVVGDINTTGIQNLALKIRGDQLYRINLIHTAGQEDWNLYNAFLASFTFR